mmetsp:Transcript_106778/g.319223  ORF Transcript_106778/g.319223 Transcript_106778/m.319223 type:complete len:111 (+) Transcript_106778:773-1105(+)
MTTVSRKPQALARTSLLSKRAPKRPAWGLALASRQTCCRCAGAGGACLHSIGPVGMHLQAKGGVDACRHPLPSKQVSGVASPEPCLGIKGCDSPSALALLREDGIEQAGV